MKRLIISEKLREAAAGYRAAVISCRVVNSEPSAALWEELDAEGARFVAATPTTAAINQRPAIAATRAAYKALGKDPNRYRPSAEALCRRLLKDKSLYRINTLVDLINLLSIRTGYSIGGFDEAHIAGDTLTLGVGEAGEPFCGIGRGPLNIEGLPVWRDARGGIGTPTSDEERTKISLATTRLLMIINGYDGDAEQLRLAAEEGVDLLRRFACATEIESEVAE
jgi:DNA/RNA-binding domain of Phe-tRNA-synthetase-like protein